MVVPMALTAGQDVLATVISDATVQNASHYSTTH